MTASEAIEAFHLAFLSHLSKDPNKALYVVKGGQNLHTRLEFSRRSTDSHESVLDQVSKPIADSYRSSPFSVSHYKLSASIVQKIDAMALRQQTRDLFDLAMLLERHAKDIGVLTAVVIQALEIFSR